MSNRSTKRARYIVIRRGRGFKTINFVGRRFSRRARLNRRMKLESYWCASCINVKAGCCYELPICAECDWTLEKEEKRKWIEFRRATFSITFTTFRQQEKPERLHPIFWCLPNMYSEFQWVSRPATVFQVGKCENLALNSSLYLYASLLLDRGISTHFSCKIASMLYPQEVGKQNHHAFPSSGL